LGINIKGKKVRHFSIIPSKIGKNFSQLSIVWDGKDNFGKLVNSGIYLYKLQAGNFFKTKKMILVK